jgi:hypothetical protein
LSLPSAPQFERVLSCADLQHQCDYCGYSTRWVVDRATALLRYDAPPAPEVEYETSKDRHNQEAEAPEGGDVGQAVPGRRSFSFQEGPERVQGAPTDHGNGVDDTRDVALAITLTAGTSSANDTHQSTGFSGGLAARCVYGGQHSPSGSRATPFQSVRQASADRPDRRASSIVANGFSLLCSTRTVSLSWISQTNCFRPTAPRRTTRW